MTFSFNTVVLSLQQEKKKGKRQNFVVSAWGERTKSASLLCQLVRNTRMHSPWEQGLVHLLCLSPELGTGPVTEGPSERVRWTTEQRYEPVPGGQLLAVHRRSRSLSSEETLDRGSRMKCCQALGLPS